MFDRENTVSEENLDPDWIYLIQEAKAYGLNIEEIRNFLILGSEKY
ncbi:anti-repressor SinI family protein [Salinibacillus xinjiangensis]|uniref:DNA-binding anti-repressor SinI n=1 Tax=Salinibacillus xinjiangensis TaxID=1229268 RepID=A0A6G1X9G8_9BACI|nr:anti-repressor SinI family protein [Salinibacillus xinjiangensis]MRG87587.1 DNA-binding anti-repressor SinI [Salinibacillus xinjiangensis]